MKKFLKWVAIFFLATILLSFIVYFASDETATQQTEPLVKQEQPIVENIAKKELWTYTENVDKMEGTKQYFAQNKSTNTVNFKFPYDGGSYFVLHIRNVGNGNEVILQVSKGSFMPSVMSDETVKVKFDENNPALYTYNGTTDASNDIIFLDNADAFITALKKSKKLLVQATFFDEGSQYMEFDTEGIVWNR